MVRTRLPREPEKEDAPRKGSKDVARHGKKRRGVAGGSPLGLQDDDDDEDEEDALGACEEDEEGLEGLGVPLDSVVKVSAWAQIMLGSIVCFVNLS